MVAESIDNRVANAVRNSDRALGSFRRSRRAILERYLAGANTGAHAQNYWQMSTPVNLIKLAGRIYTSRLVTRNPRVMVVARSGSLAAEAFELQSALNMLIGEIDLAKTLRECTLEAMFSLGITKVGFTPPEHAEMMGYRHDGGQAFADPVALEDFMFDVNARRWDQAEFFADRYRVPADMLRDSPLVQAKDRDRIKGGETNHPDGTDKSHRLQTVADESSTSPGDTEIAEHVWLCDVYLPREAEVRTYLWSSGGPDGAPLYTSEWAGHERGPYHILGFGEIPGSLMPDPPASSWVDLHDATNRLYRKIIQQAARQKSVMLVAGDGGEDARRINSAADGEAVQLTGPRPPEEGRFGGPDNQVVGIAMNLSSMFRMLAGNLDALGGLAPSAETAAQDRIISESANQQLRDMQSRLHDFVKGICESLADLEYNDPVKERTITKELSGGVRVVSRYGPERREADFREFNFNIVPHSMEDRTPMDRARALSETMQMFMGMAPFIDRLGGTLRVDEFARSLEQLHDEPLYGKLIDWAEPSLNDSGEAPAPAAPVGGSTRKYERISRAGTPVGAPDTRMASQILTQTQGA